MARETDYTVYYRAAADFSALAREAAKAKAILKAMREEEEKANKVSLQDQDRLEKARTRARKALEAQNMAATVSARISREMADRGKREAETVRELARGSEVAARQINKLAEAYKKLNLAASGDSSSSKNISERTSFAAVSAKEIEKVTKNLAGYITAARDTADTNTTLSASMQNVKQSTAQATDILARLSTAQKRASEGTTEITVSTKRLGDVIETTTRRVTNAGTEAEKVVTTIRRVTKEVDGSGRGFVNWAGTLAASMRRTWREADEGVSIFTRLRASMSGSGSGDSWWTRTGRVIDRIGESSNRTLGFLARLPRAIQVAIGVAAIFEPAVAVLGSLGAAALGAANNLAYLAGSLAAIPGMIAAGATAMGALLVATTPVIGIFKQYAAAQKESEAASSAAGRRVTDNSDQIRSAARGVRSAMESLADAQRAEKRAQEDLSEAWRDAKKDLQDLRDEVSRGSLDEEAAEIRLARALESQKKINADIKSSALDRREANLDVKEAEAGLADVRKRNKENQDELTAAEKRGLANSEQVIRAQENLANAQRGVRNAQLSLVDAKQRLSSASRVEATEVGKATTQQDRYQKMLDQTGPKTRKFVEYVLGLQDAWKSLQRDTSEAFFKNIVDNTSDLNKLLPVTRNLLTTASDALGRVASKGIEMMSSGPWRKDFKQLSKDNAVLIGNMGDAGLSVADAFRHITMAAGPFTEWVSSAIKDGAASFAAWAKKAREDRSIQRFLEETKERMQQMWQITKNVLSTLKSWGTASNDFGQWLLDRVEAMTARWKDNAKAQEASASGLRKYLQDVRPVLTALGSLVGAVGAGFGQMMADPENMAGTIKLLQTLERDVLPPLMRFLDELNDAGIATTVAEALGKIFDAFANFLEAGGGEAIANFVNAFADVISLFAELAAMPYLGDLLGHIAANLLYIAGAAAAAKLIGLFKLWEMFKWMGANGKSVVNRFREVGDAAAEAGAKANQTTTTTQTTTVGGGTVVGGGTSSRPGSPIGTVTGFSTISSAELSEVKKNVAEYNTAAGKGTTQTGLFKRAMDGLKGSAGGLKSGLMSAVDFLGGPWGVALLGATALIGVMVADMEKQRQKAKDVADAYKLLGDSYNTIRDGGTEQLKSLVDQNKEFGNLIESLDYYGISTLQVSGALKGNKQDLDAVNGALDERLKKLDDDLYAGRISRGEYGLLSGGLREMQGEINAAAEKQQKWNDLIRDSNSVNRTWKERLGGMSRAQVEAAQSAGVMGEKVTALSTFLDTMSSATSTAAERASALKAATDAMYGSHISANEATENWNRKMIEFSEVAKRNHGDLRLTTKGGLETRDALQEAAKATRDETIALIASGTPYETAIKKHADRIKKLKEEAREAGLNKEETDKLIKMYGNVPGQVTTKLAAKGIDEVYAELEKLQVAQLALREGLDPKEAWKQYQESKLRNQYATGRTTGRAAGGPVWGEGTKTSDSIAAWLSDGEWVHKAASVDYYGHGLMRAINNMEIKKDVLDAAMNLSRGTQPKEQLERDPMYNQGGAVLRLASGGFAQRPTMKQADSIRQPGATWPFETGMQGIVAASKKIFEEWKRNNTLSGDGGSVTANGLRTGILSVLGDLRGRFGSVPLISGLRPGSTTLSGSRSYHALGRAIDLAPVRAWAEYLQNKFGGQLKELITPWRDLNMWQGRPHRFSRAVEAQHGVFGQNAHIHAAYAQGGPVDVFENMMKFNGLASPAMTGAPATNVAGLSQAARSVVNNNGGITIGDVTINNPMQEPGGESIRKTILRNAMLFDGP